MKDKDMVTFWELVTDLKEIGTPRLSYACINGIIDTDPEILKMKHSGLNMSLILFMGINNTMHNWRKVTNTVAHIRRGKKTIYNV